MDLGQFLLNQMEKSGEIKNSSVRVVDLGMNINITWLWAHWHLDNLFYRIIETSVSVFFLAERFILRFESVSAKQRRCHLVDHIPDFFLRRIKPNPAQPVDQTLGVAQKNFYSIKTKAQKFFKTSR